MQTAYTWGWTNNNTGQFDDTIPRDPRNIYVFTNCLPWFGSVPVLTPYVGTMSDGTYLFANVTTVFHGQSMDGVLSLLELRR